MKQVIILTTVFVALAILVEIVYTVCRIAYEKHQAKLRRNTRIIYVDLNRLARTMTSSSWSGDVFNLGVTNDEVDKVRIGDEE